MRDDGARVKGFVRLPPPIARGRIWRDPTKTAAPAMSLAGADLVFSLP
jgi:hypothetical protein